MRIVALVTGCFLCASAEAGAISVDGDFSDWVAVPDQTTDAGGDNSGFVDVTFVKVQNEGAELFLHFDTNQIANYQSGPGSDGSQVIEIEAPDGTMISFDMRARSFDADGSGIGWSDLNFAGAPTYADDAFEMRFDLSSYGAAPGEVVTISMSDSDSVSAFDYTLTSNDPPATERSPMREEGTSFRVMSQNTRQTGLFDNQQSGDLSALIDAIDADIYAFQEEYNSSAAQIANLLSSIDPHGDGASWNVVKQSGTVVASRSPVLALPASNNKYIPAAVDLPGGPVVVVSIHLKCCGYYQSSEDNQRIGEVADIIDTVNSLRAGTLGGAFLPYQNAPVVIVGDWNLVGSREPLTLIENELGLTRADVSHLVGEDIFTWTNPNSSFTPGYLDLVAFDDSGLDLDNRFVLDTRNATGAQLVQLGLGGGESDGSDHLTVVADFSFPGSSLCDGDANGDSTIDVNDISYVLFRLGGVCPPCDGDANGDNAVDVNDISYVLFRLGDTCP